MATKNRKDKAPATAALEEARGVIDRSKQGDITALPRLRELLEDRPALWRRYGDLAAQAEAAWVGLASGQDLYLRESLFKQAAAMRKELATPSASPIEKLLVERVVACWMQMAYFDCIEAQSLNTDEKPRLTAYRAKRQEQAHRMYLTSLAALTTLRKLLPGPTVIAMPSPEEQPRPHAVPNKRRNGHAPATPNGIPNRLVRYLDNPPAARRNGRRRQKLVGTGTGH